MGKALFIDIRDKELKTYIFDFRQGRYELKDSRQYPVSDKHDFNLEVASNDIEDAYLSLPISYLNFRVIDLPFSDKDRIREVLPFELDGMILGGSDRVVFDGIIVGRSDGKYRVLAVYIEKSVLGDILGKLKSYNIDPVFVTSLELKNVLNDFASEKLLLPAATEDNKRAELAVEEMKAPSVNLRRDEFTYTRNIERTRKSLKVTAALIILLALILSSDLLLKIIFTKYQIAAVRNDMRKTYQGIFPGEKNIINELHQLKSHMKELRDKEEIYIGANPLELLMKLSQTDKQNITFNEITTDGGNVLMKGEAPSLSDIQQIKGKLEQFFNEVNIADSKSSAQGRMTFTITAKEKSS